MNNTTSEMSDEVTLVIASEEGHPGQRVVWGTGGWLSPDEREALDWFTLSRLLGWQTEVVRNNASDVAARLSPNIVRILIACDPDLVGEDLAALLKSALETMPLLMVTRAGSRGTPVARLSNIARGPDSIQGADLEWIGPGGPMLWRMRTSVGAAVLATSFDDSAWATLDRAPLIVARPIGRGTVATLGFHPSGARDVDGSMTALLKHLLTRGSLGPVAWLDLEGSMVLRMDDPGAAQNVYLRTWSYPQLGEAEWNSIADELRRHDARISIGYVPGWVDDGDVQRGTLIINGNQVSRVPGQVYPSHTLKYHDRAGHIPGTVHDYEGQFRAIQALRAARLGDVELHGYTHMYPDSAAWAKAPDRYDTVAWYRELGTYAAAAIATRAPEQHPLVLGLDALRRYFGVRPTTLIPPGDEWTTEVLERALGLGLQLVDSYYLALRDGNRFCWATHVCSPYLDEPNASWFDSGLPVVGYFHDCEPSLRGIDWLGRCLNEWQEAGAKSFIDFRELAAAIGRRYLLADDNGQLVLRVTHEEAPPLVRQVRLGICTPGSAMPATVTAEMDTGSRVLPVDFVEEGVGRVLLS